MRRLAFLPSVLSVATVVALVVIFGIVRENVEQIRTLRDSGSDVAHTLEVQQYLDDVMLAISEAERNQIAYLLTKVEAYLDEYKISTGRLEVALQRLGTLTADSPGQQRRIGLLREATSRRLERLDEGIATRQKRGLDAAASVLSDVQRPILTEIRSLAAQMAAEEATRLAERRQSAEDAYRSAVAGRVGSALVTSVLLLSLVVFAWIRTQSRERTTQMIAREREHLEVTLASIGDAVIATDVDGRVTIMNTVAATLTGWAPEAAIGRPIDEIFRIVDEETRQPVTNPTRRMLSGGKTQGGPSYAILISRDGVERPVDDSGAPIRAADGGFRGAVLVFRDVTARRAHEQALRESEQRYRAAARSEEAARKEAETANRLKDEFLAVLSHELRTPLNAVVGWVQILMARSYDDTVTARGLASIKRNADAQQRLVEDLLDVSRIVTGKFSLQTRTVDLCTPVSAAVDAIRPAAVAKGIALHAELATPAIVSADPDRVQQVAGNLLSNAVKFTPVGGRIDVALTKENGIVTLSVKDTGKGLMPDLLPYIFDRFRQGDTSTTRSHGGLGLGLAIVKHIVEAHGGTIEAQSDGEDRGAVFLVNFSGVEAHEEASLHGSSKGVS